MVRIAADEQLVNEGATDLRGSVTIKDGANVNPKALTHRHVETYEQESDTTAAAEDRVVHVAHETTTIVAVKAGAVVANVSGATVDVDLHKNGSSILSSAIQLSDSDSAYELVDGTGNLTSTSLVAGDVLEIVVTVAAGGGTLAKGVFAQVVLHENGD